MAKNDSYTPSKAYQWNRLACDALHSVFALLTIVSRALVIVNTAMYDAWTNYNEGWCEVSTTTGCRLKLPDNEFNSGNRKKASSHAAYTVLQDLFCAQLPPEKNRMFREFMCGCGHGPDDKTCFPITRRELEICLQDLFWNAMQEKF